MKRAILSFAPYALSFRQPFQTARETLEVRQGYLVRLRDDEGREGFGEAAPIAGFGMESLAETRLALQLWAADIPGLARLTGEPLAIPLIAAMPEAAYAPAACHGLESALADLQARRAGVPLYAWLLRAIGWRDRVSHVPPTVAVNATLGALTPEEAGRSAAALASEGFGTIKIKVADSPQDRARVRAVHQAAPHARLRVDANGGWDEHDALAWLRAHVDLPLEYAEQPVAAGDWAALARITLASPVRIAADESVLREADVREALARHAAHVLVLKPMALGGPLAALHTARTAIAAGADVVLTTTLEGAIGRATALHVAVAAQELAGRPLTACGLATGRLLMEDLVAKAPTPSEGRLAPSVLPGLGLVPSSGLINSLAEW